MLSCYALIGQSRPTLVPVVVVGRGNSFVTGAGVGYPWLGCHNGQKWVWLWFFLVGNYFQCWLRRGPVGFAWEKGVCSNLEQEVLPEGRPIWVHCHLGCW